VPDVLVAASIELADAAQRYESHHPGLGERFLNEVRDAFDRIDRMPLAGRSLVPSQAGSLRARLLLRGIFLMRSGWPSQPNTFSPRGPV
jgi:hypothetical protein